MGTMNIQVKILVCTSGVQPGDRLVQMVPGVLHPDDLGKSVIEIDELDRGYRMLRLASDCYHVFDAGRAFLVERSITIDPAQYPHACPRCSGPAYVGITDVDCARRCS